MKVLYVATGSAGSPGWVAGDGEEVELIHEADPVKAVERLEAEPVDAVVVDPMTVARAGDGLHRLHEATGGAALLLMDDPATGRVSTLEVVADGVLPRGADPSIQAALVCAAVERRRAVEELKRSEARFRDVIERNADAIVVVDREGVVRFANAMAGRLFDRPRDALVGTPFGHPMTVGESTEVDLVPGAGGDRVVELRVVESAWEGEMACIVSLRDITERKRAEERGRRLIREQVARSSAERAARQFRFLAEAATVLSSSLDYQKTLRAVARLCVAEIADWALIYILDEEGALHRLEVTHREPSKLELTQELRHLPIPAGEPHPVREVLETGRPRLVSRVDDAELLRVAESPRHLELLRDLGLTSYMLVPLLARGRSLGAIGLMCADPERAFGDQDLALAENLASRAALAVDNARLYREAREATLARTNLLAVISHDLRTPLNAIIGYAELLIMGVPETLSPGTLERVERMRSAARHLLDLINQLLSLSRLDAGGEVVRAEEVDLAGLIRDVAAVVEPMAIERKLELQLDLPRGPVALRSDPAKLRQVFTNLTANAVKFTEQGEVRVRLEHGLDGDAVVRVEDTGAGIAPEHLDRIFEPFWQVDTGPGGAGKDGVGLGLSLVQRLVELLGGEITVESELGRGSTFTVRVPGRPPSAAVA